MISEKFTYLPQSPADERRGLFVSTAGSASIPFDSPYPPCHHPEDYQFDWKHGRVLPVYALVYITRGEGHFESRISGSLDVKAGDIMVLFPGVWHRYAPTKEIGWDEYWVGFGGDFAYRLMNKSIFSKKRPLLHVGSDEAILSDFIELTDTLQMHFSTLPVLAAAAAHRIIAHITHSCMTNQLYTEKVEKNSRLIQRAKMRMLESVCQPLNMEQLAGELGIGYSHFRHLFKRHTGLSPKSYLIDLRIERAKTLLNSTSLPVKEIACQLSFEAPYYFMRQFKQKTGMTPSQWRTYSRGMKI